MKRFISLVMVAALMALMSAMLASTALADQSRPLPGVSCLKERSPVISGIIIDDFVFECSLQAPLGAGDVPI